MKTDNHPLGITEVFEIRIPTEIWSRIRALAKQKHKTFSWVVRLCVFRHLASHPAGKFSAAEKQLLPEPKHRHLLCLYGEDPLSIRFAAALRGMTITALVLTAIEEVLPALERGISEEEWLYEGVKVRKEVSSHGLNIFTVPDMEFQSSQIVWIHFQRKDFHPMRYLRKRS